MKCRLCQPAKAYFLRWGLFFRVSVCFKPGQRTCIAGFICRRLLAKFRFFFVHASCFAIFVLFSCLPKNKTHRTLDTLRSGERPASPCTSLNILIKSYRLQTIETKHKKRVTGHPTKERRQFRRGRCRCCWCYSIHAPPLIDRIIWYPLSKKGKHSNREIAIICFVYLFVAKTLFSTRMTCIWKLREMLFNKSVVNRISLRSISAKRLLRKANKCVLELTLTYGTPEFHELRVHLVA